LGPWSSAVELVNELENAVTVREDKLAKQKQLSELEAPPGADALTPAKRHSHIAAVARPSAR
jgi:hypothetical protein